MADIEVEVNQTGCRFTFDSARGQEWASWNFHSVHPRHVDIWHSANYILAIEADGISVTPGTLHCIEEVKRKRLAIESAKAWDVHRVDAAVHELGA
jgi:hypothetical protein